ncbi:hypothetical protein AB0H83_23515 [Dactylosporangium sp. NPDC050688]|uniref:hypothetical protein n=1 Tax=Dactylosporangium sp. NPDC050688 TaxID=3157217 RepID=UPI0033CDFE54
MPLTCGRRGLQLLALRAPTAATVDVARYAADTGAGVVVHPPRHYPEYPFASYYAGFIADPDGIRLEVVHLVDAEHWRARRKRRAAAFVAGSGA